MGKRPYKKSEYGNVGSGWLQVAAAAPGVLMCLMIAVVLVCDLIGMDMGERQYVLFPMLFRIINPVIMAAGAAAITLAVAAAIIGNSKAHDNPATDAGSLRNCLISNRMWIWFGLFGLLIIVSTAVNGINDVSLHGIPYRNIGFVHMLGFLFIYCGASSVLSTQANGVCTGERSLSSESSNNRVSSISSEFSSGNESSSRSAGKYKDWILTAYLVIADLIVITVLYDRYIGKIQAYDTKKDLSAVFFNGNHYGYFLVMAVLIGAGMFLYSYNSGGVYKNGSQVNCQIHYEGQYDNSKSVRGKAAVGGVSAVLNLLILALNHSMGCIIAVITVTVISAVLALTEGGEAHRRGMFLIGGMALCCAAAIFMMPEVRTEIVKLSGDISSILANEISGDIGHNRLGLWSLTCRYIEERPWLGYGCEGMSERLYNSTGISSPHNEVLTYAAYYGIPAAVFYLLGIIAAIIRYFRNRRRLGTCERTAFMAAMGYFISSFTGVSIFYTIPFFFIFLGMSQPAFCSPKKQS